MIASNLTLYASVAALSYWIGSVPFGYILVRLFLKQDIRQTGSGNIGATNVARSGRKGLAIATLLLDAGKGAAAVFIASHLASHFWSARPIAESLAVFFAVFGHLFPAWLRFRGGKGVATAVGAFLAFSPIATLIALCVFSISFAISRIVSLSSVLASLAFPFLFFVLPPRIKTFPRYPAFCYVLAAVTPLLIILKHHANIRRLLNGTEPRFSSSKPRSPLDSIQEGKNA